MANVCDNKSVGILIRQGGRIVCIERFNYPQAYALPAGHLDGDSFADASVKEAGEEVGARIIQQKLLWRGRIDNPCKREGGSFHEWEVYEAFEWDGVLYAGSDAKRFFLVSMADLTQYAKHTEYFMQKYGIPFDRVGDLTRAIFGNPQEQEADSEWQEEMGLEPVWYFLLKKLKVL